MFSNEAIRTRFLWILNLSAILIVLLFLFSSPPIKLKADKSQDPWSLPAPITNQDTGRFLLAEYQKAIDEIKMRISYQDTWFHYKFLLVGALAGALLAAMGLGLERRKNIEPIDANAFLKEMLESKLTLLGAAIACMLAVVIDVHIRNDTLVANQLGSWLARYIEPTFIKSDPLLAQVHSLSWENFLREGNASAGNVGMHLDELYSFTFWPHLHGLTLVLYFVYVVVFRYSMRSVQQRKSSPEWFDWLGFIVVHVSFAAFAWSGHTVPSAFQMKVVPFIQGAWTWQSSWIAPLVFFLASVPLPFLCYRFYRLPQVDSSGSTEESGGESAPQENPPQPNRE